MTILDELLTKTGDVDGVALDGSVAVTDSMSSGHPFALPGGMTRVPVVGDRPALQVVDPAGAR